MPTAGETLIDTHGRQLVWTVGSSGSGVWAQTLTAVALASRETMTDDSGRRFVWTTSSTGQGVWVEVAPSGTTTQPPPIASAVPLGIVTTKIPVVTAAAYPPGAPQPNDLWYDSTSGFFFIYFNDGDTIQWVVTNPGKGGTQGPPGLPGPVGPVGPVGPIGPAGGSVTITEGTGIDVTGGPNYTVAIDPAHTFPPVIPTGPAIATWPFLPLTGGTLTGNLTGTGASFTGVVDGYSSTVATAFYAGASPNGVASLSVGSLTNPGYFAIFRPGGQRLGYIGFNDGKLSYNADSGFFHEFTNGTVSILGNLLGTTATFSGEVKALTPTFPDNDTTVATTAYVTASTTQFAADMANTYLPLVGGTLTAPGNLTMPGKLTVNPSGSSSVPKMLGTDNSSSIASTAWVRDLFATRGQGDAVYVYAGNTVVVTTDPGSGNFRVQNAVTPPVLGTECTFSISCTDADSVARYLMLFQPGDSLIVTNEFTPVDAYARYDLDSYPVAHPDAGSPATAVWVTFTAHFIDSKGIITPVVGTRVKITGYLNTATGDGPILGVAAGYGLTGGGPAGNVELDVDNTVIAPLDSPVFTGNPTAPTPLMADNDTSIATTKFVKDQGYITTTAADAKYVDVAGDTMTGPLTGTTANFATSLSISGYKAIDVAGDFMQFWAGPRNGITIGASADANYLNAGVTYFRTTDTTVTYMATSAAGTSIYAPLAGTTATFNGGAAGVSSGVFRSPADGSVNLLFAGATMGVRIGHDGGGSTIQGVDSTGIGSFQPLRLNGSVVTLETALTGTTATFSGDLTINKNIPGVSLYDTASGSGNKFIRVYLNNLEVLSSDYSHPLLSVSEDGTVAAASRFHASRVDADWGVVAGPAGSGQAQINGGGGANTGYIAFVQPDGSRRGYIGFGSFPGSGLSYVLDGPGVHAFSGDLSTSGQITAPWIGIGAAGLTNVKLVLKGGSVNTDWLIYGVDSASTFKFGVTDAGQIQGISVAVSGTIMGGTPVGTTPPATPTNGQLWWNTDGSAGGGNLYINYNDGNSAQWVPAAVGAAGPAGPPGPWTQMTQAAYDALPVKDPNTLYVIVG